jgi:hypothetical protein
MRQACFSSRIYIILVTSFSALAKINLSFFASLAFCFFMDCSLDLRSVTVSATLFRWYRDVSAFLPLAADAELPLFIRSGKLFPLRSEVPVAAAAAFFTPTV